MAAPIDRKIFFDAVRVHPFPGTLTAGQVDGLTRILDEWERRKLTLLAWLAYMLATVFHETWYEMVPIRERGSEAYLHAKPYWPYVGEGLVQVTWRENYLKFGGSGPGDLLKWTFALRALFDGMIGGKFTGLGLGHFFTPTHSDPVGARKIINGQDQAALIAGYHYAFLHALTLATQPATSPARADKPAPLAA